VAGRYFEEFNVGDKVITPGKTITDTAITTIVGLAGFTEAFFNDEEYAKTTVFGGRIAPGRLTLLMMGALSEQTGIWERTVIALLGINNVRIVGPLRAGDTITVEIEIVDKRETSKGDRGIIVHKETCKNQRGEVIAQCEATHSVWRKQPAQN